MFNARPLVKAFTTNQNASAFTAKAITRTKPSGNGVLALGTGNGGAVPQCMRIFPVLLGADNDVTVMRLWGWHRIGPSGPQATWFPEAIGEFTCTASTFVGETGAEILATERLADTIVAVATVGEATYAADVTRSGSTLIFSPANNTPAWIQISTFGAELLEFDSDQTTGTSTFNALIQFLDESEC